MAASKSEAKKIDVSDKENLVDYNGRLVVGKWMAEECGADKGWTIYKIRRPGLRSWIVEKVTFGQLVKRVSMTQEQKVRLVGEKA